MKKVIALILTLLMAFSLVACSGTSKTVSPTPSASETVSSSASPSAAVSPAIASDSGKTEAANGSGLGFYDPNQDYYSRQPYKIVYMILTPPSITNEIFSNAFKVWATRLNFEFTVSSANNDADAYINNMEIFAAQGFDGFLLDAGSDISARVVDVCSELNLNWMSAMTSLIDADGNLAHPFVSIDNYKLGQSLTTWLYENAKSTWGDFDQSKLGMITCDFSVVSDIVNRTKGAADKFKELYPAIADTNYWNADAATYANMTAEIGYNLVSSILAAHPEIEYWFISSATDDLATGAVRAVEAANKSDNALIISIGGDTLFGEWDSGSISCWKAAVYVAPMLYTEGMICGLIALIDGSATPETLWPQYKEAGEKYATVNLKCEVLTHDNYQEYLEWVDAYTGTNIYNYKYNGTQYQPR